MEFRSMRRVRQQLRADQTEKILSEGKTGILSVTGDGGYPYAVPLNYVYGHGKIYFHCAKTGHKLDAIRSNPKVSFCVVADDRVIPDKFTTAYISAVAFGTARILESDEELLYAVRLLNQKYSTSYPEEGEAEIQKGWNHFLAVEITINHVTGKRGSESEAE